MKKLILSLLLLATTSFAGTYEDINSKEFVVLVDDAPKYLTFIGTDETKKTGTVTVKWFEWWIKERNIGAWLLDTYDYTIINDFISVEGINFVLTTTGNMYEVKDGSIKLEGF